MPPRFPALTPAAMRELARETADAHPGDFSRFADPVFRRHFAQVAIPAFFCRDHHATGQDLAAFCIIGTAAQGYHNITEKVIKRHQHWALIATLPAESFHADDRAAARIAALAPAQKPIGRIHVLHAMAATAPVHETVEKTYRENIRTVLEQMHMAKHFGATHGTFANNFAQHRIIGEARHVARANGQFAFLQEIKGFERQLAGGARVTLPMRPSSSSSVAFLPRSTQDLDL